MSGHGENVLSLRRAIERNMDTFNITFRVISRKRDDLQTVVQIPVRRNSYKYSLRENPKYMYICVLDRLTMFLVAHISSQINIVFAILQSHRSFAVILFFRGLRAARLT